MCSSRTCSEFKDWEERFYRLAHRTGWFKVKVLGPGRRSSWHFNLRTLDMRPVLGDLKWPWVSRRLDS